MGKSTPLQLIYRFLSALARLFPRSRWRSFIVTRKTILGWHRAILRRRWRAKSAVRGKGTYARRTLVALVLCLADENRSWGYMRIAGEIKKLGRKASASTVRRILISHRRLPASRRDGPTWSEFIAAEARAILACDFFTVDSILGRSYHALFFISEYVEHYNEARSHRSLGHMPPEGDEAPNAGKVEEPLDLSRLCRRDRLCRLIPENDLAA